MIVSPKIKYTNDSCIRKCIDEDCYSNVNITGTEDNIILNDITLDSSIFNNINFSSYSINNIDLIDCVFNNCDLSNVDFTGRYIKRIEFNNSKGSIINSVGEQNHRYYFY